jgi:hypothetical protein
MKEEKQHMMAFSRKAALIGFIAYLVLVGILIIILGL